MSVEEGPHTCVAKKGEKEERQERDPGGATHIPPEEAQEDLLVLESSSRPRKREGIKAPHRLSQVGEGGVGGVGCRAPPVVAAGAGIHSSGNQ